MKAIHEQSSSMGPGIGASQFQRSPLVKLIVKLSKCEKTGEMIFPRLRIASYLLILINL